MSADRKSPSPPETPAPGGMSPTALATIERAVERSTGIDVETLRRTPLDEIPSLRAASPASAPRETPDPARIALSRQATMVAATVVWLREWVERHAPFCPGGGGCAANCKPVRDALVILSDLCSAAPSEAPASAPSPGSEDPERDPDFKPVCSHCGKDPT